MFQYLSNLIASNLPFKMTKFASLFFAAAIIFFACKRETDFLGDKQLTKAPLSEKVQSIKHFFDEYTKGIAPYSPFKNINPLWDYAVITGNMTEIPFTIDGNFHIPSRYKGLAHLGKQRLAIFNTSNNQKKLGVFEFMPDEKFEGNVKEVNATNFKSKKFSGMIVLRNLSGSKVNGFVVESGNIVKKLVPSGSQANISRNPNQLEVRGCTIITYQYGCGHFESEDGRYRGEPQCLEGEYTVCWDDGGNNGGGGNGGDDDCSWCDDLSDNWNVGTFGSSSTFAFKVVTRPCVSALTQGFTTAGVFSTLFRGGTNLGSTLSGQLLRTTEGNFIDVIAPITTTNPDGTTTTNQIYMSAFSLSVSGIQPNGLTNATPFSPAELNTISTSASNAYVAALGGFARGERATNTGVSSVDFLSLWASKFNGSNPNYYMNAESGDLNASTARGTPVSSCP
jgi:hypothetical protein